MIVFKATSKSLNDLFDDLLGLEISKSYLKTDIYEDKDKYILIVEIPGVSKEDIKLDYEENYLTLSVTKKNPHESKDNCLLKEIKYGSISRKYFLEKIDVGGIKATYNNGILNVLIPKIKEESKQKIINIE